MTTAMTELQYLLHTHYDDIPMDTKHRVLGEALYYLEVALSTNTIPGIGSMRVVPNMCHWSQQRGDGVHACLGGIWYMATTQTIVDCVPLEVDNILVYMEDIALSCKANVLVGLPAGTITTNYDGVLSVRDRLQSMMALLPLMQQAYQDTRRRWLPNG